MNPDELQAAQDATTRPLPDPERTPPPRVPPEGTLVGSWNPAEAQASITPPGYEVVGELGRGGMGVVYKARQINASRIVALKMILAGGHSDGDSRARFRTEAEAIARLSHVGIVQVFEVGEHQGLPFFSLEFCSGGLLDKKLAGTPLPDRDAASLVRKLAEAMDAAHRAGVIHRDLKPANVLLTADGTPKVTDFGLAKKLDEEGGTRTGSVMGTPSYMAPEQASGDTKTLGPACDIYALGAILYECLTGRPPFKAATALDTVMLVVTQEPASVRSLTAKLSADLETIALKCLQKDPKKRYGTAGELAEDLGRWLEGRPIAARPVGKLERGWRWCRRNPAVAASMLGVAMPLTLGATAATVFGLRAEKAAGKLKASLRESRERLYLADLRLYAAKLRNAADEWERNNAAVAIQTLESCRWDLRGWEYRQLEQQFLQPDRTLRGHSDYVTSVSISPDGLRIATSSYDKTAKVWDARTGEEVRTMRGHSDLVISVSFSPDGSRVVTGSADKTAKVWDARTGEEVHTLRGHSGGVTSVSFSPDGSRIITSSSEKTAKVWDARTGEELSNATDKPVGAARQAVSPDGRIEAVADNDLVRLKDHTLTGAERDRAEAAERADYLTRIARFDPFWHRRMADDAAKVTDAFAAAFHLRLLAQHAPDAIEHRVRLVHATVALGRFREANDAVLHAARIHFRDAPEVLSVPPHAPIDPPPGPPAKILLRNPPPPNFDE